MADTEAELAAALKALTESRARFGDLEARAAELEAVVQAMGEATDVRHGSKLDRLDQIAMLYATSRSVVLANHDREVAARALEDMADVVFRDKASGWGGLMRTTVMTRLRNHATSIRKGVV